MSKRKDENCWKYRSGLEKFLIVATVLLIIIFTILVIFVIIKFTKDYPPKINISLTNLKEISQINQRIDPTINPCDNFYKFSCGNLLKSAHGDENLGPFFVIQDKIKRQIEELHGEPFRDGDHKMVRIAKGFYRTCMDESAIKNDGLQTIEKVLNEIGGWPVIKGEDWDESKFWWIQMEYKLRKLGYFYSSFLNVIVDVDPRNDHKFIFKVTVPDSEDLRFDTIDKQIRMVNIAMAFGADRARAVIEMTEVYDFMLDMKREAYLRRNDDLPRRFTITEFQQKHKFFNWVEFMNNIVGPAGRISKDDYVIFLSPATFQAWFNFLLKTPKRILANYMIWKVIEEIIPYIPKLQIRQHNSEKHKSRSAFCIQEIRKKFTPNPIDIMYVRKYLPKQKISQIKEIITNMKNELKITLQQTNWARTTEKKVAIERLNELTEVIGAPEDFFDNDILHDLDFDMEDWNNKTFLAMAAQINKNHQSWLYNQMYNTRNEFKRTQWKLQTASAIGDYCYEDNVINLPATIFQDAIFNENRSKYFNYGSMGIMMGHHFFHVLGEPASIFDMDGNIIEGWSNISSTFFKNKSKCFIEQLERVGITNRFMIDLILHQNLGLKISYSAYNKWIKNQNRAEPEISVSKYSSKQLFWISAASYFCQPSSSYSVTLSSSEERRFFSYLVQVPLLNSPSFAKDFNCSLNSPMNPRYKCELF